eukprot:scaffold39397_cov60-Phaeocystis_antarctica.AAC.4
MLVPPNPTPRHSVYRRTGILTRAYRVEQEVAQLPLELPLGRGRLLLAVDLCELELAREQLRPQVDEGRVVIVIVRVDRLLLALKVASVPALIARHAGEARLARQVTRRLARLDRPAVRAAAHARLHPLRRKVPLRRLLAALLPGHLALPRPLLRLPSLELAALARLHPRDGPRALLGGAA